MTLDAFKKRWFFLTACSDLMVAWAILKVINNLPSFVINAERKREISSYICFFMFRFIFYLNPQIKIKSQPNWQILDKEPFVILINHTSPLDSIFFAASCPLKYATKIRTLAKAELFQMPFLGDLLKYCGHFPVHFLHSAVGSFSVDKDKQAKVIDEIKRHLNSGGHLAFFPEGQLNRSDTKTLQPFRLGLFKIIYELNINNIYGFLHSGLENTWHPKAKLGGTSAEIHSRIFPLLFSKGTQVNDLQHAMQKSLDLVPSQQSSIRIPTSKL